MNIYQSDGSQKRIPAKNICFIDMPTYEKLAGKTEIASIEAMPKPALPLESPQAEEKISIIDNNGAEIFQVPFDLLSAATRKYVNKDSLTLARNKLGTEPDLNAMNISLLDDSDLKFILYKLAENDKWVPSSEGKKGFLDDNPTFKTYPRYKSLSKSPVSKILTNLDVKV